MKKYEYYVAYAYMGGFGSCSVNAISKIKNFSEVLNLRKIIESKNNVGEIVILNWELLK